MRIRQAFAQYELVAPPYASPMEWRVKPGGLQFFTVLLTSPAPMRLGARPLRVIASPVCVLRPCRAVADSRTSIGPLRGFPGCWSRKAVPERDALELQSRLAVVPYAGFCR